MSLSAPTVDGWTPQDRADLLRAVHKLARSYGALDLVSGATDSGEPWAALVDPASGEVHAHFARLAGRFVTSLPALGTEMEDGALRGVIDRALFQLRRHAPEAAEAPAAAAGQGAVVTFMSRLLSAAGTVLVLVEVLRDYVRHANAAVVAALDEPEFADDSADAAALGEADGDDAGAAGKGATGADRADRADAREAAAAEAAERDTSASADQLTDAHAVALDTDVEDGQSSHATQDGSGTQVGSGAQDGSAAMAADADSDGMAGDPGALDTATQAAGAEGLAARLLSALVALVPLPGFSSRLLGTAAGDRLLGTVGHDLLWGLGGDDLLIGRTGHDLLLGGAGDDALHGGEGDDSLLGGHGRDHLEGGIGHDLLIGGHGRDILRGGAGNDVLLFDSGDQVVGEAGGDLFVLVDGGQGGAASMPLSLEQKVTASLEQLTDFEAQHDRLILTGATDSASTVVVVTVTEDTANGPGGRSSAQAAADTALAKGQSVGVPVAGPSRAAFTVASADTIDLFGDGRTLADVLPLAGDDLLGGLGDLLDGAGGLLPGFSLGSGPVLPGAPGAGGDGAALGSAVPAGDAGLGAGAGGGPGWTTGLGGASDAPALGVAVGPLPTALGPTSGAGAGAGGAGGAGGAPAPGGPGSGPALWGGTGGQVPSFFASLLQELAARLEAVQAAPAAGPKTALGTGPVHPSVALAAELADLLALSAGGGPGAGSTLTPGEGANGAASPDLAPTLPAMGDPLDPAFKGTRALGDALL